jgi:hypothetical protein
MRVAGETRPASEVRAERIAERECDKADEAGLAILGLLGQSPLPMSRRAVREGVNRKAAVVTAAVAKLLADGAVVEVRDHRVGRAGGYWPIWTAERAAAARSEVVPR